MSLMNWDTSHDDVVLCGTQMTQNRRRSELKSSLEDLRWPKHSLSGVGRPHLALLVRVGHPLLASNESTAYIF